MKKGVPGVYLVWRVCLDLSLPGDGVGLCFSCWLLYQCVPKASPASTPAVPKGQCHSSAALEVAMVTTKPLLSWPFRERFTFFSFPSISPLQQRGPVASPPSCSTTVLSQLLAGTCQLFPILVGTRQNEFRAGIPLPGIPMGSQHPHSSSLPCAIIQLGRCSCALSCSPREGTGRFHGPAQVWQLKYPQPALLDDLLVTFLFLKCFRHLPCPLLQDQRLTSKPLKIMLTGPESGLAKPWGAGFIILSSSLR